jgi:hypothetical protein
MTTMGLSMRMGWMQMKGSVAKDLFAPGREPVYPVEIIFARLAELYFTLVRDTKHFKGVIADPAFDIPVGDAIDLYLAVGSFKSG